MAATKRTSNVESEKGSLALHDRGVDKIARVEATDAEVTTSTDEAERHAIISEIAYLRAEARGFAPGYELDDWLEAVRHFESRKF
ncbi:MAG: DUF2934 domain-containing protein [Labrys sp. (in: a-proteobacteria)]